jgi:hypothetical protein
MSFLSTFPANLAKLQFQEIHRRSADTATGYEYMSALVRRLVDVANAYDEYVRTALSAESALGRDELAFLKLFGTAVAQGLEFATRILPVFDVSTAASDVSIYAYARPRVESAETAETSSMLRMLEYTASARFLISSRLLRQEVVEGNIAYQSNVTRSYELVAQGRDFATLHYPVSESVVQDRISAYDNALKQLSNLQQGRYAYARDWNVLADYAKSIINYVVDFIKELEERGHTTFSDLYEDVLECQRLLSAYKYLKSGDTVMPDHTNILIDVARCLELRVLYGLLFKILLMLRTRVRTRNVISFQRDDSATGLDKLVRPPLIILANTDDWTTVSRLIDDGTIVFVNYGTTAITPDEVRNIVENKEVVFAVLIDTQPVHRAPAGAFYGVFYTREVPHACDRLYSVNIVNATFLEQFGLTNCHSRKTIGLIIDYIVSRGDKLANAILYAVSPFDSTCGYAYVKYEKGAIIELPYDGSWQFPRVLDWYIGAIAHILLGEPDRCFIANNPVKLRRIVWMAGYRTTIPAGCPTADRCIKIIADEAGLDVIDLRTRR